MYRMCPVTLESALYFLDSYLVETMDHERTLAAADFQVPVAVPNRLNECFLKEAAVAKFDVHGFVL